MEQMLAHVIVQDLARELAAANDPRAPARPERPRRRWLRRRRTSAPAPVKAPAKCAPAVR